MSNMSRRKGARVENEVAHTLQRYGIPATKRSGMFIPGDDINARVGGRDLRVEVKSRADGFGALYKFLEQRDVLIVRADRKPPLAVLPLALAAQLATTRGSTA